MIMKIKDYARKGINKLIEPRGFILISYPNP